MPDPLKPSRLLSRLDAEIASAPTQVLADCKRAERAGYLARIGCFEQSDLEINTLRQKYLRREVGAVACWINLVEGINGLSRSFELASYDKLLRAHALSMASNSVDLRLICAAWLAHVYYLKSNFCLMTKFADDALLCSTSDQNSIRARALLVTAVASHRAGRKELSDKLYKEAHLHASVDGDDAMLSALMHNKSWLQAVELRFYEWHSGLVADDKRHALLAAESTRNFDELMGFRNLETSIPMLRAIVLASQGKYDKALELYNRYMPQVVPHEMSRWSAILTADQAWCAVNVDRTDGRALKVSKVDWKNIVDKTPPDEKFLIFSRICQIQQLIGDLDEAAETRKFVAEILLSHQVFQIELARNLDECSFLRRYS